MKNLRFADIQLDGGCAAFDFTNTVNTRKGPAKVDYMRSYEDLVLWADKTQLILPKRLKIIYRSSIIKKEESAKTFGKAISTREMLYNLFSAIAKGQDPSPATMDEFNKTLGDCFSKLRVTVSSLKPDVSLADNDALLDEPIRLVMRSAYDILTTEKMERIKECPACGWLFIDRTKNGKRRWCDMKVCGSNDKAKRYYHRKKKNQDPAHP
ncbi:MAG: CGNR zinc finger domain-containing protein [Chitinophagaceae bacterium]|nr:CGNR zinc finger domain-containing protein [Chitinophagaceae bacterium]